jgi:uncharacterized membrane protein YedE/YeeE
VLSVLPQTPRIRETDRATVSTRADNDSNTHVDIAAKHGPPKTRLRVEMAAIEGEPLAQLAAVGYQPLAVTIGLVALALLLAGGRGGAASGLALAAVAALAWVAADVAGYGYGLGFVGAADGTRLAIQTGTRLPFQLWLAAGVLAGATLASRPRLRLPDRARTARAIAGGLLMGIGASIAHGCNIGHGLTGLPLLSLGSALSTASMAAGALVTWRALLATRPAVRGTERLARA